MSGTKQTSQRMFPYWFESHLLPRCYMGPLVDNLSHCPTRRRLYPVVNFPKSTFPTGRMGTSSEFKGAFRNTWPKPYSRFPGVERKVAASDSHQGRRSNSPDFYWLYNSR